MILAAGNWIRPSVPLQPSLNSVSRKSTRDPSQAESTILGGHFAMGFRNCRPLE